MQQVYNDELQEKYGMVVPRDANNDLLKENLNLKQTIKEMKIKIDFLKFMIKKLEKKLEKV